jgi:WXG100 family type VII secretion target
MASSYEVTQVSGKVKNIYYEIDNRRMKLYDEIKNISGWWKGEASNSFNAEYNKINNDITALLNKLIELERNLKSIAVSIDEYEALEEDE